VTAVPLMDGAPRTTSLVRSARARRQNAEAKAEKALSDLASTGQPVTFAAVARAAGVSSDFLYRHPAFRDRIAQLRTTGSAGRPGDPSGVEQQATSSGSASAAVRALSAQIKQMRRDHLAELSTLRRALENAHGENLTLRRRLKLDPPSTQ
jgi:hypothetical protein